MADIIGSIIEVAKCLVVPMERQFNYLCKYHSNIANLKAEVEKLKDDNASIQHRIEEAGRKGEEILDNVAKWVEKVNKLMDEAETFIRDEETAANNRCMKRLCPSLKTRYKFGKKVVRMLEAVTAFRGEFGRFHIISYRTIPKDIRLTTTKDYEALESRMFILNDILSTLSNPDVDMIGIYGMGGIGKTTLAKEVARKAESIKLFDQVVFTEVSPSPDIKKIQGEIADKLGLRFLNESVPGRANELCSRLKKEKKILIILDNIWESLDLVEVGIPYGGDHKGCKVLLTARSVEVLSKKMDSKLNFSLGVLREGEVWSLFKKMAGDYIEGSEFKSVAKEVANKCAGLPVSIVTVARALKNSKLFEWKDALQKLRMPSSDKDIQLAVYSTINLSYEKLDGDELKKIFLLIAYTYVTSIEELLIYGIGLGLLQGINKIEVARNRVQTLVCKLKDSCVLLESSNMYEDFSMHDVVRDVAISIASTEHHVFTARDELIDQQKWPDDDRLKLCTSIVLYDVKINELPSVLECPQLKFFQLNERKRELTLPEDFFARMIGLRVLALSQVSLSPLSSSIGLLTNLRALCLCYCKLPVDMAVIGDLKKLEILLFYYCDIEQLPVEVRQLTLLRMLHLRSCYSLNIIPPNVISSFSHLEELYIIDSSIQWEVEGLNNSERRNVSLDELKHLSNLTTLELFIVDDRALPRDLFFEKLERYKIKIGERLTWNETTSWPEVSRTFQLSIPKTRLCLKDGHIMKLKGMEELFLFGEQEMENVVYGLDREGFSQLKNLQIEQNPNLLCIVDSSSVELEHVSPRSVFPNLQSLHLRDLCNLKTICRGHQLTSESFSKLRVIELARCHELRNIYPIFIARALSQLEKIDVWNCENIEGIFDIRRENEYFNINNNQVIEFGQLRSLSLVDVPKLTSLCSKESTEVSSEDVINVPKPLFNDKVALPKLEDLKIYKINVERIWQGQLAGFQNLRNLIVEYCDNLRCLCSSGDFVCIEFPSLKYLEISECPQFKEFIGKSLSTMSCQQIPSPYFFDEKVAFPSLEEIVISNMDNFRMIWHQFRVEDSFCKLKSIKVDRCGNLQALFPRKMYSNLIARLESLSITSCGSLEVIFEETSSTRFVFSNLISLTLSDSPKLRTCFPGIQYTIEWPVLKKLELSGSSDLAKILSPQFHSFQLPEPNKEIQLDILAQQPQGLLVEKIGHQVFPNLEELTLKGKSIATLWKFREDLLWKLKSLMVEFDRSTVASSLDFLLRFHIIKMLEISGYYSSGSVTGTEISNLNGCGDVKHIFKQESNLDNLVDLQVHSCNYLINLVPSSASLQNLTTLKVTYSDRLINIVPSSTAKSLVRLREMTIYNCKMIEEIVANDEEDATKDDIVFSELRYLSLTYLESLTSFCFGNDTINFPSLETLIVANCPKMKIFCGGELSTPKLHKVQEASWDSGRWKDDLNTTIQHLYKEGKGGEANSEQAKEFETNQKANSKQAEEFETNED